LTRADAYPLPRIDDVIDVMANAQYFSTIVLISGYWQCRMDESDKEKTAFFTPTGLFYFKVMPFGLCNAPATYQRLMDRVLKGLTWEKCIFYLDDVIVFAPTFEEHLKRLEQVLERFRRSNLKIQPSKCRFALHEVHYLRFRITKVYHPIVTG
jgi:hypothetical protein